MHEAGTVAGAVALAAVLSVAWGRSLGYLHERSDAFRRATFVVAGFSTRPPSEVRALLLACIYYGIGLIAALAMALLFNVSNAGLVASRAWQPWVVPLGVVGEISLAALFVDLSCRVTRARPDRFREIREIPWMAGLRQLPRGAAPWAAGLGGSIEELFYRGVVLTILTDAGLAPFHAVMAAGALFLLQQLLQVQTPFQAMVLGAACVAISLVGGMLVVATGSVIPAVLSHASFVVFYVGRQLAPAGARPPAAEIARL